MNPRVFVPLAFCATLAALFGGYFIGKAQTQPPLQGAGPGAALDKLNAADPDLHFYLAGKGGITEGFFVTETPKTENDLGSLVRSGKRLYQWEGVVLVTPADPNFRDTFDPEDHAELVGSFTLFGDPVLRQKVSSILGR